MSDEALIQSRKDIVKQLGGPEDVARTLGLSGHPAVVNWYKNGFPRWCAGKLAEMCRDKGVEPHPEMVEVRQGQRKHPETPTSRFMKALIKSYGRDPVKKMSVATGIPESSLKSMRARPGHIKEIWAYQIGRAAKEQGVPVPPELLSGD